MKSTIFTAALAASTLLASIPSHADDRRDSFAHFSADLHALRQFREGREVFRYATFGDEDFWGGTLGLHLTIAGAANGGIGPGLSPKAALELGLKVDVESLSRATVRAL